MNTSNLKKYAPQARRAFLAAVMARINELGIHSDTQIASGYVQGEAYVVDGRLFDSSIAPRRERLVAKVKAIGFLNLIEQAAFTWFNRFCAIRYMELHDYLDHGYQILSHPDNPTGFQILEFAQDAAADLGLERADVLALKLDANNDEKLFSTLLLAQCHQLHLAMPFLFEAIDDDAELLLPGHLLRTDSVIRGLVDDIPLEDWRQVEVIGWLYQFYISEKKDQVIGKVVKSEDIPAATQLFTPNWIVQYLVQNSVGRQWLQTYPDSPIKAGMDYYIEPAVQTDEVNAQLAKITPDTLNPESIKVLDPACGSGHILVEAYTTLKAIYADHGHKSRDIPKLILQNNLYGLDIDDRAAQLAGFALMMMARADDPRIFSRGVKLNVLSLQDSHLLDIPHLWRALDLNDSQASGQDQDLFAEQPDDTDDANYQLLIKCKAWFEQAKTFGSLIDVPAQYQTALKDLFEKLENLAEIGNTAQQPAAGALMPFVQQAFLLSQRYDSVIANPPYMGGKGMNAELKSFAKIQFPDSKSDLFAMFMERAFGLLTENGFNAQVNMQSWMFLSSYEKMRESLLETKTFVTMAHLGARAFGQISGEVVQTTAWVLNKTHLGAYRPVFFRLIEGGEEKKRQELIEKCNRFEEIRQNDFKKIPGNPIAYWIGSSVINVYEESIPLKASSKALTGMRTGDNERFLRYWYEVSIENIGIKLSKGSAEASGKKWFPYNKGGGLKKWYGNNELVVNWQFDGDEIKELTRINYPQLGDNLGWKITNEHMYFTPGITWGGLTSAFVSFRWSDLGALFDSNKGAMMFPVKEDRFKTLALLASPVSKYLLNVINPTLSTQNSDIDTLPVKGSSISLIPDEVDDLVESAIKISRDDESGFEQNIEFIGSPLIPAEDEKPNLILLTDNWFVLCKEKVESLYLIESKINKSIIDYYGFSDFLNDKPFIEQITININPQFRYKDSSVSNELQDRQTSDLIAELISYSIGCMMGRYSLDREGLVYAHSANEGYTALDNEGAYKTFPADDDGIIPLTDLEWFSDDATCRFRDFVTTVWGEENLQDNLDFVAESLCLHALKAKRGESSLETIRRYMSGQFYKDHLKTYKKRPIYWLFSSGKQKSFECLVYLHRYNSGTLARMRTEYVTPLIGKYEARLGQLGQQIDSASTSEKTKLNKDVSALEKKQMELRTFDDKLKHYADMGISLDLDDGVKVNYGKFGDLLAEVKAVHGKVVKN